MGSKDYFQTTVLIGRDAPPSHYVSKIESFPQLSNSTCKECVWNNFDAGGFKWKMSIYMKGDSSKNVRDHISIYLELLETSSLPVGWKVNAIFNFFIFNQLEGKYFSPQDGRVRLFHAMKTQWGSTKFIDLKTFSNPVNGFLIDDCCIFGAEVFVVKNTFKGECLTMMNDLPTDSHTWKVDNFSTLENQLYNSETFGSYKWKVLLYPNGLREGKGNSISLFLDVTRSSIPSNAKLQTKFILRVKDQRNIKDIEYEADYQYTSSSTESAWGFRRFMTLAKLKDPNQGYLVNDSVIIEAEVTLLGMVLENS